MRRKKHFVLDLFFPGVQNILMEKRLNNATNAINAIKDRLAEYGLQVDYQKYFEEKLQVPLMSVRALSEVETDEQRNLLKNLFTRHLIEKYFDDTRYPRFIQMIEEDLKPLDIKVLLIVKKFQQDEKKFPVNEDEYEKLFLESENIFSANWKAVKTSLDILLSLRLIEITSEVDVPKIEKIIIDGGSAEDDFEDENEGIPQQKVLQTSPPRLTELGTLFISAYTDPL